MAEVLLKARNISKAFPGVRALDGVNFELDKGELHCLVGENGAGKTTFVKALSGAYLDYEGELYIQGEKVQITNPLQAVKLGISAVQQHRDLVPTLSGAENIYLGLELTKGMFIDFDEQYRRARKITDRFDKTIELKIPVQYLTVAEQEIVAIAKALLRNPRILILDEATAPLDRNERKVLFEVLREIKSEGEIGIIFISHNLEELFEIGDRVTVFKDGQLVDTTALSEVTMNEIIRMMIGKEERQRYSKKKMNRGEEILRLSEVSVPNLLEDVNLAVHAGEIVGVAGRLGSNKEKIAEAIFGLSPVSGGDIIFKGKQISAETPAKSIHLGIGLLPVDRREEGLVLSRAVAENIILTWINKFRRAFSSAKSVRNVAGNFVKKLSIKTTGLAQRVEYLSGGNQQKVVMAKWLAADSDLLVLLEPTEGIDVGTRWEIYQILEDLAEAGKAILVISSDLDELLVISDRIVIMGWGRVIEEVRQDNMNKEYIFEKTIARYNGKGKDGESE
ncbi:MAG: sugar ABC transporter ATP-binding protein [Spirochaetaceae bacterium]|nr:MAG: sugar ABC transporter ATP-binding protein [Spirochaetaceae bacterium]